MAEQLDNSMEVDARADVWAAVVVLFILITGVHPFARGGALPASRSSSATASCRIRTCRSR